MMAQVVVKLSDTDIQSLLNQKQFETEQLPQGMKAKVKTNGVTISVYNSNKVMFQGKQAESVAEALLPSDVYQPDTASASSKTTASNSINYDAYHCIGSDEAGSGDYFGPLTVCAAYVDTHQAQILKELGVQDSKNLSDKKITELAEQIITFIPYSLMILTNDKYNERQAMGWSQVKMKAVLHNAVITKVLKKIDATELDYIVIDQFSQPAVYKKYALTALPEAQKTCFETKGESKSIAIAAASIIARYAFVKQMEKIGAEVNDTVPKGASHKVDLFAAQIIERWGLPHLDHISKKHFANRDKANQLVHKKYH
mgnify:FL=1